MCQHCIVEDGLAKRPMGQVLPCAWTSLVLRRLWALELDPQQCQPGDGSGRAAVRSCSQSSSISKVGWQPTHRAQGLHWPLCHSALIGCKVCHRSVCTPSPADVANAVLLQPVQQESLDSGTPGLGSSW